MISFVKDNEGYLERGETRKINVNESKICVRFCCVLHEVMCLEHIHQIVKGFSSDWKKALDLINQDIMRTFTNFKNGTAILQVISPLCMLPYQYVELLQNMV